VYYSWLAYRLGVREGRDDRTALPYGINTVSLFAHIFLVMLPVKLIALDRGATMDEAITLSWQAGLVACLGSGVIELIGSVLADPLRRWLPRAALLSTLAGIGLTFIALGFLFRTYEYPVVALVPLGIILLTYFGRVQFPIPGGLLAVLVGTALAWMTGLVRPDAATFSQALEPLGWHPPGLFIEALWQSREILITQLSVILPMGLFNLVGSLQNLESAEAAGDPYPTAPCLAANGVGSVVAAVCGSCFPTTIYIGHPGWKAMGARIGYSWLNGVVMALLCVTGAAAVVSAIIPVEAGMAIVLWIGIIIGAQSFQATPSKHAPAVIMGLLPGIAGWGAQLIKTSGWAGDGRSPAQSGPPADLRAGGHLSRRRLRARTGADSFRDASRRHDGVYHRAAICVGRRLHARGHGLLVGGSHAQLSLDAVGYRPATRLGKWEHVDHRLSPLGAALLLGGVEGEAEGLMISRERHWGGEEG
jgi:AGZA family xanthine/uracil permease-like MFS transporter